MTRMMRPGGRNLRYACAFKRAIAYSNMTTTDGACMEGSSADVRRNRNA